MQILPFSFCALLFVGNSRRERSFFYRLETNLFSFSIAVEVPFIRLGRPHITMMSDACEWAGHVIDLALDGKLHVQT